MTFLGAVYNGRVSGRCSSQYKMCCPPDEPAVLVPLARGADLNHTIRPCRLLHVAPLDERGPIQNRQRHTARKGSGNPICITLSLPRISTAGNPDCRNMT